jgi:uncharacterized membrane protein YfcA
VLPDFTPVQWFLAALAAVGVGLSKSGLYGVGLFHVVIFANLFPGIASTGVVLPMLIAADFGAVLLFRRNAEWRYVIRTLPPAVIGVALGWAVMGWTQRQGIPGARFNPVIGAVVLAMAGAQIVRNLRPNLFAEVPHTHGFAWTMGLLAGVTTMVANAAGPIMALYLLAVSLPKDEFVGTGAWFFLLINCIKVPFSAQLGLITAHTLAFNAILLPLIAAGLLIGRSVVSRVPQLWFDRLILIFAGLAALKLMW